MHSTLKKNISEVEYIFHFLTSVLNHLEASPANTGRMVLAEQPCLEKLD